MGAGFRLGGVGVALSRGRVERERTAPGFYAEGNLPGRRGAVTWYLVAGGGGLLVGLEVAGYDSTHNVVIEIYDRFCDFDLTFCRRQRGRDA